MSDSPQPQPEPSADVLALQAGELLDRYRGDAARRMLGPALARHPDHPALLAQAARADYQDDHYNAARETLARLLIIAPQHLNGRWLMFLVEMETGRLTDAESIILDLLRESPEATAFYAGYSRLMLRALNFGKARALADEALRRAPDDESALRARALCDLVDQRGDSVALARMVANDPHDVQTLRLVVLALVQAHKPRQALHLAQELLRMQPNDPSLLDLVRALRADTHWSLAPLWPMLRWGWYGSIGVWIGVVALFQVLRGTAPEWAGPVSFAVLGYVAYSWIWPPLLRRWLNRD
jgi:tetratricopeptide (TPR) repeat protein